MRRYRRVRRFRHISLSQRKHIRRIILRIFFIVLCTSALIFLSILLGLHLRERADVLKEYNNDTETINEPVTSKDTESSQSGNTGEPVEITVTAADIDMKQILSDEMYDTLTDITGVYNAVSFRVNAGNELVYQSKALIDYYGIKMIDDGVSDDEDEGDHFGSSEDIEKFVRLAKSRNFRTSALYEVSRDCLGNDAFSKSKAVYDSVVLKEMVDLGFDEILIDGLFLEETSISVDKLTDELEYIRFIKGNIGNCDIGVVIPESVFQISQSASGIQELSKTVDFLTVSIVPYMEDVEETYSLVIDNCYSLKGNFRVYNIRFLIKTSDAVMSSAIYSALNSISMSNIQFTTFVEDPVYHSARETQTTFHEEIITGYNDSAFRKEDYIESEITEP